MAPDVAGLRAASGYKRVRPRKITDEKIARLLEVGRARLKAEALLANVPVNKQLAYEIGVSPKYLHNVMHRLTSIMRMGHHVPHETLRRSLFNDKEFGLLMDSLNGKARRKAARTQETQNEAASV